MSYRVTIYCPDRHLLYNGRTPDDKGVGGGVTARLRLAQALAGRGNKVSVVANVPVRQTHQGVAYRPLEEAKEIESEVLILNTTGGSLDLTPILDLRVHSALSIVWVGGKSHIQGLAEVKFDYLATPSNFIRRIVQSEWGIAANKTFVMYNGVTRRRRTFLPGPRRDPFRLVYTSHPAKGLDTAISVLRLLRSKDRRFELHVYGGNRLWGGEEEPHEPEAGVYFHGLTGQRRLAWELQRAGFSLNLQSIEEAFGISLMEAMAAGLLVVASPVGAYCETIRHGHDGFLVAGDHLDSQTRDRAASLVLELVRNSDLASYIRHNAVCAPFDWDTVARAWEGYWDWALNGSAGRNDSQVDRAFWGECVECSGSQLALADGYHCINCGGYARAIRYV